MNSKIILPALLLASSLAGGLRAAPPVANTTNQFAISGMSCDGCAGGIASELRRVQGVAFASVTFSNQLAVVAYNTNQVNAAKLIHVVRDAGYNARLLKP